MKKKKSLVCLFTKKINKILNFEYFFDLLLLLLLLHKILLSPHYNKRHKKGKRKHAQTHSFRTCSDMISFFFFWLLCGPIRSRLAEHSKKVKLRKSIRSKLFSPIRMFSQSPLSSVITCGNVGYIYIYIYIFFFLLNMEMLAITNIMFCCYDWLEFCYVILLWWIFLLLMLEEWV